MRIFNHIAGAALAASLLATQASAQVPSYAQPPLQRSTYSAAVSGLAAPQTGAGDLACIYGSATKLIRVKRIEISGTDTTLQTSIFNFVKRSTADTGGTPGGTNSTVTFTSSSASIAWSTNGLYNGQPIILLNSGGAMPTVFVTGTTYYVVNAATSTFSLATTPGGTAIIANSGGTGTTTAYVQPFATPRDSANSPGTAVINTYTAVPTVGTIVGVARSFTMAFNILAAANNSLVSITYDPNQLQQEVILRGAAQALCVNAPNAFTTAGPVLDVTFDWTEQ